MNTRILLIIFGLIGIMLVICSTSIAADNNSSCVNTWGYWLNNSKYQSTNGSHRDPGWDKVGEDTQFFGSFQDPPANTDMLTWFEILLIPPKTGNMYLNLAHQYVAAWLNISSKYINPEILGTAMADAEALLAYYNTSLSGTYPPSIPKGANHFTPDDRSSAAELASLLDQFNNGYIGVGLCSCPCWNAESLASLTASSCMQFPAYDRISVATAQNFNLSTSGSESSFSECNVVDLNKLIGFALAITYGQYLYCKDGLWNLIDAAGISCSQQ